MYSVTCLVSDVDGINCSVHLKQLTDSAHGRRAKLLKDDEGGVKFHCPPSVEDHLAMLLLRNSIY